MTSEASRPSAAIKRLRRRAEVVSSVRGYFARSGALEVTTPVLSPYAACEPALRNLELTAATGGGFLRTSPESALKRLLAAGSGDIYEIGPAFRADEIGRLHLTEFSLLEWYRVGRDHHELMSDVSDLLAAVGFDIRPRAVTYGDLFAELFGVDAHTTATPDLARLAGGLPLALSEQDRCDRALLFDALYAHRCEPHLAGLGAVFVYDFPCELRAYSQLSKTSPTRAERFELIIDGVEVANGYHEITSAEEQAQCFAAENALRAERGLAQIVPDAGWLTALRAGMPPAAGVALGLERLLLVLDHARDIREVLALASER